jgi:hypothetical protein
LDESFSTIRLEIDEELARYTGFSKDLVGRQFFRLHNVEKEIVNADINRYLRSKLAPTPWAKDTPTFDRHIQDLVAKSDRLFIFAFTAVRHLSEDEVTMDELQARFSMIIGTGSNVGTRPIDDLYENIFGAACQRKEPSEKQKILEFIHSIVLLCKPLSVGSISQLFDCKIDDVRIRLRPFHSVIDTPKSDDEAVLTFHASFPDYINNKDRSKQYAANRGLHSGLASMCLQRMNAPQSRNGLGLREDICSIGSRQISNADISNTSIQQNIPSSLQYACVFWASHLKAGIGEDTSSMLSKLDHFVRRHILHWLECLSLINELGISVSCLQHALGLLPVCIRFTI